MMALVEELVDIYNSDFAVGLERLGKLMNNTGPEEQEVRLAGDVADLIGKTDTPANEQVAYLMEMAKAHALELLGETQKAVELVDRYV